MARCYRRLSGGGTSAQGGDVTIAVQSRYDFKADGRYERSGSVGAVNSGASTGVGTAIGRRRAPEGGQYRLDRHTLTLTGADGRSRRLFFAYSCQKEPPRGRSRYDFRRRQRVQLERLTVSLKTPAAPSSP